MNYFDGLSQSFIIAEIGVNHNGNIDLAFELIDEAKKCGADAVKFQTFKAINLVSSGTPKVSYQTKTTNPHESHFQMIKKLELSFEDHHKLRNYCVDKEIEFISTPYDVESAKFLLEDLKINFLKTAAADLVDYILHDYIAKSGTNTIISVGMSDLEEIRKCLAIYESHSNTNVVILHCVSNYPCSANSLNLRVFETLKETFKLPVGFSDHSSSNHAAIISLGLGACIVEKHFTLDRNLDGPDHRASITPSEFKLLVDDIRLAETMLGSSVKSCQPEEMAMRQISRKSLFTKRELKKGEVLQMTDLQCLRPGGGICPMNVPGILGSTIIKDLKASKLLSWSDFEIKN